jgi:hypothetical protein
MKYVILFLALICGAYSQESVVVDPSSIYYGTTSAMSTLSYPTTLSFANGLTINCSTGEVKIPEGLKMSDAAREFWREIENAFPYAFPKDRVKKEKETTVTYDDGERTVVIHGAHVRLNGIMLDSDGGYSRGATPSAPGTGTKFTNEELWTLREELPKRVLTDSELDALLEAGWEKLYRFGAWYASGSPGPEYHQEFTANLQIQATLRRMAKEAKQ